MFDDRRKYPRYKDFVRLRVADSDGERNFVTTDISPIGVFFAAAEAPEPGSTVKVILRPEGMKVAPIEIECVVVRTVPPGGTHQPGFVLRWVKAHSDAGGEPLYRVLKRILRVPQVTIEMFGHELDVDFNFPGPDEDFDKVLQIDHAPKGPLLQQRREEKHSGPPKAPPPVLTPIEKPGGQLGDDEEAAGEPKQVAARRSITARRNTSMEARGGSATSRSKTFPKKGPSRRKTAQADDILAGAGALRRRDSDVTQLVGRSRSLQASHDEPVEDVPAEVTIMDDIRVAALGLVGKTRTERLIEKAKERHEEKAINTSERSQIFGKSNRASSLGGRSMSTQIGGGAGDEVEHASVKVDMPITYELDQRFVPGRLVQVAPLALEVIAEGATPQLDQNIVINMPVLIDGRYRTINLMGKLLRLPEQKEEGISFVFHIERVHEGDYVGAFTNFIAEHQKQAE